MQMITLKKYNDIQEEKINCGENTMVEGVFFMQGDVGKVSAD